MKKMLTLVLCVMLLASCLTTAMAEKILATPKLEAGPGENNTFFATASLPKMDDYYSSVALTLFGYYGFYQSVQTYTTSDSASNTSAYVSQRVEATARVYPSRVEDTRIKYSVQNVIGFYKK